MRCNVVACARVRVKSVCTHVCPSACRRGTCALHSDAVTASTTTAPWHNRFTPHHDKRWYHHHCYTYTTASAVWTCPRTFMWTYTHSHVLRSACTCTCICDWVCENTSLHILRLGHEPDIWTRQPIHSTTAYIYIYICMYTDTYNNNSLFLCVYIYIYTCVYIYIYNNIYIYIYICISLSLYIYIYILIDSPRRRNPGRVRPARRARQRPPSVK